MIFGLGKQEAKAAENMSTENAKEDDATTSDNEVVSETENNSTTRKYSTNPIRKKRILD